MKQDQSKEKVVVLKFQDQEVFEKLESKAESKGLKPSAYCKMLVYEHLN